MFTLMGCFWAKYTLFELKKYRGGLRGLIQNLKKNWIVVWKMTWGIWQIFTRALESGKIPTLMGSFCPKQEMHDLKIYRGFMFMTMKKGFLKTTDQPTTYHRPPTNRPPTKCTDYRPTDHRPIRNMRTRNPVTNFKWISD